jgi:hypothetical protein
MASLTFQNFFKFFLFNYIYIYIYIDSKIKLDFYQIIFDLDLLIKILVRPFSNMFFY